VEAIVHGTFGETMVVSLRSFVPYPASPRAAKVNAAETARRHHAAAVTDCRDGLP
jgi:hypothetical protein